MKRERHKGGKLSLSAIFTILVVVIVFTILVTTLLLFMGIFENAVEKSSITASEQAVVQVLNTVESYTRDMEELLEIINENIGQEEPDRSDFISNFLKIRTDVVSVTLYSDEGEVINCWTDGLVLKNSPLLDLSYTQLIGKEGIRISKPHVASIFYEYYPWVVTISEEITDENGQKWQIAMDIRFSNIASYIDDVGIGQHGYCYILDSEGNIVYHPQQQLIYYGIKAENTTQFRDMEDIVYTEKNVIYTIRTLESGDWRIVGVSYVDELVTNRVTSMASVCVVILGLVLITVLVAGIVFSGVLTKPAKSLAKAMGDFEKDAENFESKPVYGTKEIVALSTSFDHMVLRIQALMETVREEEISLRKTELKALQAQINPHFLYNTLDSIAWMCEEERTEEAVEMVNALASLFRISISKGNELISLENELEHAKSYLKIQNFRYKNQFTYHFNVDPECLVYMCNKITLQPIIENAINHGLDPTEDEGEIEITIAQDDQGILLSVEDNGTGMSQEQCREILQREPSSKAGIGIKNVNDRIKIYFGEKYGISIISEQDVGTNVEIRIPKIRQGDYEL